MISYNYITFGCLTIFKMWISLDTLSTSAFSTILSFSKIFIATFSLVTVWIPSLTLPKVPYPMDLPNYMNINLIFTNMIVTKSSVIFISIRLIKTGIVFSWCHWRINLLILLSWLQIIKDRQCLIHCWITVLYY